MKPKRSTALIVVDVQQGFLHTKNDIDAKDYSAKLVEGAVKDKVPIIFVEFRGFGRTHKDLVKFTKNYTKKLHVKKPGNDGSDQVLQACKKLGIRPSHFVVCGIYFRFCVRATVDGLSKKSKAEITVVEEATDYMPGCRRLYKKMRRVTLLKWLKKKSAKTTRKITVKK